MSSRLRFAKSKINITWLLISLFHHATQILRLESIFMRFFSIFNLVYVFLKVWVKKNPGATMIHCRTKHVWSSMYFILGTYPSLVLFIQYILHWLKDISPWWHFSPTTFLPATFLPNFDFSLLFWSKISGATFLPKRHFSLRHFSLLFQNSEFGSLKMM